MREWLPPGHPVWLVITAVEDHMDTSAFHAGRKTGGPGTAGYDPDMLLTVLVWAYAHRVTSSRRIEQLCWTDVAFKVICGGNTPDHVTVADFRKAFPGMIGQFFAEVLALCARLGMGKLGVVALDGMKIAASASKSANRAEERPAELAAETVARHGATDAAEDDLFGAGSSGDEVPEDAWSPRRRDQRIAAALASVRAEREAAQARRDADAQAYLQAAAAGQAPPGKGSGGCAGRGGAAAAGAGRGRAAGQGGRLAAAGGRKGGRGQARRGGETSRRCRPRLISRSPPPGPRWRRRRPRQPRPSARPQRTTTTAPAQCATSPTPIPG